MNLKSDTLIILNAVFVTLLVGSYLLMQRRPQQPTRLRMKGARGSRAVMPVRRGKLSYDSLRPEDLDGDLPGVRREKTLNIIFNYNGHSWDAFEVLGIPAGSSHEAVRQAYARIQASIEAESRDFVEAAYNAITKRTG